MPAIASTLREKPEFFSYGETMSSFFDPLDEGQQPFEEKITAAAALGEQLLEKANREERATVGHPHP